MLELLIGLVVVGYVLDLLVHLLMEPRRERAAAEARAAKIREWVESDEGRAEWSATQAKRAFYEEQARAERNRKSLLLG